MGHFFWNKINLWYFITEKSISNNWNVYNHTFQRYKRSTEHWPYWPTLGSLVPLFRAIHIYFQVNFQQKKLKQPKSEAFLSDTETLTPIILQSLPDGPSTQNRHQPPKRRRSIIRASKTGIYIHRCGLANPGISGVRPQWPPNDRRVSRPPNWLSHFSLMSFFDARLFGRGPFRVCVRVLLKSGTRAGLE